jgi:hypothetical protein
MVSEKAVFGLVMFASVVRGRQLRRPLLMLSPKLLHT